jgi:hypothetical protein
MQTREAKLTLCASAASGIFHYIARMPFLFKQMPVGVWRTSVWTIELTFDAILGFVCRGIKFVPSGYVGCEPQWVWQAVQLCCFNRKPLLWRTLRAWKLYSLYWVGAAQSLIPKVVPRWDKQKYYSLRRMWTLSRLSNIALRIFDPPVGSAFDLCLHSFFAYRQAVVRGLLRAFSKRVRMHILNDKFRSKWEGACSLQG